ncbi:MAG: hypothetical protein EAX90_01270 [Candidatus Heimdallarchaeota archaeon]|nr:hypothetical protein [Candidatus Heimdallarchaeota archaeon]
MAAEIHWNFITDKYNWVDYLDRAIVAARFNQKDLLREFISIRCKFLETKSYNEIFIALELLLKIQEKITNNRLAEIIIQLVDSILILKENQIKIDKKIDTLETEVTE